MIFANCDAKTKLFDEAQYLGSKIWTVGMIVQVFRERLFTTIRRLHAGLDCYLRNSEPLSKHLQIWMHREPRILQQ